MTLGEYALRADQVRAVAALRRAIERFGGALCADRPGSGKTIVALGVASGFGGALVVAPATLREQWADAATRAGIPITFSSVEALSRPVDATRDTCRERHDPLPPLLIVDEAHHVRTPTTARHRRLAAWCAQRPVLLLTATPVVNRLADRDALLSLFLGARARAPSAALLEQVILRSTAQAVHPARVRRLPPLRAAPDVPGLAAALRALPPPLPASDGAAAAALIRMSLALAWQSSLAALDAALRRRQQRGVAFDALLSAGRVPSRAALSRWVRCDDTVQLAFPALEPAAVAPAADARQVLEAHLAAVGALRRCIAPAIAADTTARAAALRALLDTHPRERVVVFARHAETIRALARALRDVAGVVSITGDRVVAASGRWTRVEVLRALGPRAARFDPADPRGVRLLLATDVVAEGIELQAASVLIHADLPWTPARLAQRRGRVARAGQTAPEVLVGRFVAARGAAALIRLGARLRRKADAAAHAIAEADAHTQLERWWRATRTTGGTPAVPDGFVAAVRVGDRTVFVGGTRREPATEHRPDAWRLLTRPRRVLAMLRASVSLRGAGAVDAAPVVHTARRLLARHFRRLALQRSLHGGDGDAPADAVDHRLRRSVQRALDHRLAQSAALARGPVAARIARLRAALERPLGSASERSLLRILASDPPDLLGRLEALVASLPPTRPGADTATPRLRRLVLLSRASTPRVPPAASLGSAAPPRAARSRSPSRRDSAGVG